MKSFFLLTVEAVSLSRVWEGQHQSMTLPDYWDIESRHDGPDHEMIPDRYKDDHNADRTMHHLIRYYGTPELHQCNNQEASNEGESATDWDKPTNFVGEFVNCDEPTGKVWLKEKGAKDAGREAVRSYFGYEGKKLDEFVKENVDPAWDHFDVLHDG